MSGSRCGTALKGGKASFVDESLFGNSKPGAYCPPAKSQTEILDKNVGRSIKAGRPAAHARTEEVVTVSRNDLERMLKPSIVMSADDIASTKRELNQRREATQAVSQVRKERMIKLGEEAKKKLPETETDRLKAQTNSKIKSRAEYLLEEQEDEVKHMNMMVTYSKCVTIRDAQIEEKKRMMLEAEEDNRRQDLMMEIERLKALQQYETREQQRMDERRRGARVLEEQIEERVRGRIRQEELRDQERLMMLKDQERIKEEELTVAIEKKLAGEALMKEVAAANSEQIRRKEQMKNREKEEDLKILQYTRAKEARELEIATEKERIAAEKELETSRLRAMQERAADKAAELDELRARRYQEAKEREWRGKERATAERKTAMLDDLAVARDAQKAAKIQQRADMAHVEHDEFMRVLAVNRTKEAEEMHAQATQHSINERFKMDLQAQILTNEEKRKYDRQAYLEEGRRIREAAEAERLRLLEIKDRKLSSLVDLGVPSKYRAELEKYKPVSH
mmetsp:Transcript_18082/g.30965  ORF Transcript_18082/g.30965 Transcript_18082/m.30965 type:complete len:510 (-) Transcript_18082:446-1975(-)|eukprot:CAMPEP_0119102602 /NCGR_PEP_ID=MMETSP1180-20130426/1298_1 /TAXON_ID=3052 ORGANISM="Chlamydomonas cf sp, Strain CCMP681" /NCGR_SAMPLE_ID=MMETSP1180 /ASSEMBLY_ACC=CAM_ASM_000741 /LENGTH=509 /DNA_ID=CAMNT_0007086921 /DNA_START=135 /DNA_END=1664 /DNA_ORIENTATION=+